MYQLTEQTIEESIIEQYIPQNIPLRDKLIRKINESYQYSIECHRQANENDYTFITALLTRHIEMYC